MKSPKTILRTSPRFRLSMLSVIMVGVVGFGYIITRVFAAGSSQLYITPASGAYNVGSTVTVQVMVNTGSDPVNAVEADFTYPTAKLQFQSIDATGSAFTIDASSSGGSGQVKIARGVIGQVTGTGLVATVKFAVLASGSAPLGFLGSSAVVRSTDNTNVLGTSTGASYTLNAAATPTPTPPAATHTPTPVPGKTTPTPSGKASVTPTPSTVAAAGTTPTPATATPTGSATPAPTASSTPAVATTCTGVYCSNSTTLPPTKVLAASGAGLGIVALLVIGFFILRTHIRAFNVSGHGADQPMPAPSAAAPPAAPTSGAPLPQTFMPGGQQAEPPAPAAGTPAPPAPPADAPAPPPAEGPGTLPPAP